MKGSEAKSNIFWVPGPETGGAEHSQGHEGRLIS